MRIHNHDIVNAIIENEGRKELEKALKKLAKSVLIMYTDVNGKAVYPKYEVYLQEQKDKGNAEILTKQEYNLLKEWLER